MSYETTHRPSKRTMWIAISVTIGIVSLVAYPLYLLVMDDLEYRLSWYPDPSCYPPGLTENMVRDAFELAARRVLKLENPRFRVNGLERDDEDDWPTFFSSVQLTDTGERYTISGNGCGVTIERLTDSLEEYLVINVKLPAVSLSSVREGTKPIIQY